MFTKSGGVCIVWKGFWAVNWLTSVVGSIWEPSSMLIVSLTLAYTSISFGRSFFCCRELRSLSLSSSLFLFLNPYSSDMSSLSLVKSQSYDVILSFGWSFMCRSVLIMLLLSGRFLAEDFPTDSVVWAIIEWQISGGIALVVPAWFWYTFSIFSSII